MSKDYNNTLNLPKTDFPMRAGLPQREPEILSKWEENQIYDKLMEKNEGKPVYILHDGPPYANGDIHLGHALNKILKDIIVRYKNMTGYKAPFIPGWDTHGLPTELKARKKAGIGKKANITDKELRDICKQFVMDYVDGQREQFKRLGVLGDWAHPYITLQPEFEAKQIEVFAQMADKGAIYRGLKPVHWCSTCETALAEAEIEYSEDECKSIYVKFNLSDDKGKLSKFSIDLSKIYFVIWTTTAWTLPGNVAVCLGPDFDYSLLNCGEEYYIIASKLVNDCMAAAGIEDYKIIGEVKGKDLEGIKVEHPFLNRESVVIVGEHVTLESGTGCVHTAPGHGIEDFDVCKNYDDIPVIVPVDSHGYLTDEAGQFSGLSISEASEKIISHLKDTGYLFAMKEIRHQYPHCWRCKDPVLFRATEQWFCSIDKFKEKALSEIDNVKWVPEWGKNRMTSMVSDRKDWCISRQRKWGVPIPIFFCEKCNKPIIDKDIMMHVSNIFKQEGSDAWFIKDAEELMPKDTKCPHCGEAKFRKEKDIMDVWFDSGVTHAVVCEDRPGLKWPSDVYLEGADQYRGWFQSSLLTAVASKGRAPYKTVVSHGWVVDEDGRKQSKSMGNGVKPQEIVDKYGADILRLWVASADYHADIKISQDIIKQLCESYRKIRNTARYIVGNLYDFNPDEDCVEDLSNNLLPLDKWALVKLNELVEKARQGYELFEFHNVYHAIQKFCIVDMSNFYLDIIKDRLYVEKSDGIERRAAQTTIYVILDTLVKLINPILPYTSEEIWGYMPHSSKDDKMGALFNDIPSKIEIAITDDFMKTWDKIYIIREEIKKALETARKNKVIGSSLEAEVKIYCSGEMYEFVNRHKEDIKTVLIVSEISISDSGKGEYNTEKLDGMTITVNHANGNKCERCWIYSNTIGEDNENPTLCSRCSKILK